MNDDYFYFFFQVPVGNENQQVVQQQYQQQVMVPVSQSVQGPMPVYYSVITPTQQNSTRWAAQAKLLLFKDKVQPCGEFRPLTTFCLAAHRWDTCRPPARSSIRSHSRRPPATLSSCSSNIQVWLRFAHLEILVVFLFVKSDLLLI